MIELSRKIIRLFSEGVIDHENPHITKASKHQSFMIPSFRTQRRLIGSNLRFCLQYQSQLYTTLSPIVIIHAIPELVHRYADARCSIIVHLARVMVVRDILAVVARVLQQLIMCWNLRFLPRNIPRSRDNSGVPQRALPLPLHKPRAV